ncbi:hypothetical protein RQN30_08420 [Arcanobacterium hippocoleae]
MTALHHARSHVFLDSLEAQNIATFAPENLLAGDTPRLLDKWQLVPAIWNLARRTVDANPDPGLFILTGSAVPQADPIRHTGAGRFLRIRQRTMTWAEKSGLLADPGVSLNTLFKTGNISGFSTSINQDAVALQKIIYNILQPGFPGMLTLDSDIQMEFLKSYISDIASSDVYRISKIRSEPEVIKQLIISLARLTASEASIAALRKDISRVLPEPDPRTLAKLLELLRRVFLWKKFQLGARHYVLRRSYEKPLNII